MSIYVQHGYGKTNKIEKGLERGSVSGIIFSPRDESPDGLSSYIADIREKFSAQILFDPQFYATTISPPARDGHLPDYNYYHPGLTRASFSPADIEQYVKECIDYQISLGLDRIISPTVIFDDFRDTWSQISLSLAQQCVRYHDKLTNAPPLLISLVFSENALRGEAINEFLDIVTTLNVKGFYIIIQRNSSQYQPRMESNILENLLYFTYTLSAVNNYETVFGYTDLIGMPLHAVGATGTACGWYLSLRQFSLARFQPSGGGHLPRPRYTSIPLLNSILVIPELDSVYGIGMIREVITATSYDTIMRANPASASWPIDVSCLHHWEALNNICADIPSRSRVDNKLDWLDRRIGQAEALYVALSQRGVTFETSSGSGHLEQWRRAIRNFRNNIGV